MVDFLQNYYYMYLFLHIFCLFCIENVKGENMKETSLWLFNLHVKIVFIP